AQFYASRGYGVLQPNFRGSTGYGQYFRTAGIRQWGGLMQDDVTDATNWLINENIADGSRICIAGSSYGGYAAMMGAILEPNLYQCAISVNGVPDLPRLNKRDLSTRGGSDWHKIRGHEGKKDKEVSPYHRAKEITIPILLIAAKDDARIPYQHTKDMHKRLKNLGKNSKYVQLKTGTHYMVTAEARLKVLRETEKFLAKHIGR
ncbi:MAG: S9 family peptidase, partial [Kordiimonadaceae bacterium]|nr:S9 family peptidase [Kordiimonadaceae bacterium]